MALWLLFIVLDIVRNYYMIEKEKESPVYLVSFFIRFWAWLLIGIYLNVTSENWFTYTTIATTSFWLIFDIGLNAVRKEPFKYVGKHSGWIDRYVGSKPWLYWTFKVVALVGLVTSLIIWYAK